jgi:hypothetical protein
MNKPEPITSNPAGSPKITDTTPRRGSETALFANFEALTENLLKVPKEEVDEQRAEQEKARKRKQD